jgi:cytoskeleton protein RodZ
LERGRLTGLPEGIYRRAIIKAVAREVGLNPEQVLAEFSTRHPDALPSPQRPILVEQKATTSFNKVIAFVSAALPLAAGLAYFILPMARAMVTDAPKPAAQKIRAGSVRAEVVPVGGFVETPIAAARPVPVVVTLTISSRCQLRVIADGNEILGRTMEPGDTVPIELGDELLLLGDNAAAVQFSINGQSGRLLGAPGDVLSARIGRDDYQDFLVRY